MRIRTSTGEEVEARIARVAGEDVIVFDTDMGHVAFDPFAGRVRCYEVLDATPAELEALFDAGFGSLPGVRELFKANGSEAENERASMEHGRPETSPAVAELR